MSLPLPLLLLPALLLACATTPPTWEETQQLGTEEALAAYLEPGPQGAQADTARRRLDTLRFERARALDEPEAYEAYLERHPFGRGADAAHRRLDELLWAEALRLDDGFSYIDYLQRLGEQAEHAAEALERGERRAWERARDEDIEEAYFRYLEWYPDGRHREAVLAAWDALRWRDARCAGSAEAYDAFSRRHPDSPYADAARDAVRTGRLTWVEPGFEAIRAYTKYILRSEAKRDGPDLRHLAGRHLLDSLGGVPAPDWAMSSIVHGLYDADPTIRASAALACAERGDEAAIAAPFLVALFIDGSVLYWKNDAGVPDIWRVQPDTSTAEVASAVLERLGTVAIPPLTAALLADDWEVEHRVRAAETLGRMTPTGESLQARLDVLLDDREPRQLRLEVLESLGPATAHAVRPGLVVLLEDRDPRLAESARRQLEVWGMTSE